eukprot:scaffold655_cov225-Pinguiococcus_pyrenoidosus.AAC.19
MPPALGSALLLCLYLIPSAALRPPTAAAKMKSASVCSVAVTGGIAMGKSTVASFLRSTLGLPLHDADAAVAQLYAKGGAAVPHVQSLVPDSVVDGAVDKQRLRRAVQRDKELLPRLEAAVHPLVEESRLAFVRDLAAKGHWLAVLDVPLLFESDARWKALAMGPQDGIAERPAERPLDVDKVLTVHAPEHVQRERALARSNVTPAILSTILARQTSSDFRVANADFVVDTSHPWSFAPSRGAAAQAIDALRYSPEWRGRYAAWATAGRKARVITFDVDQTLCPLFPPLGLAKEALEAAMAVHLPRTKARMAAWDGEGEKPLDAWIRRAREENPGMAHDLTDLRVASLMIAAKESGDDPTSAQIAMRAFLQTRAREANAHAYSDVLSCLEQLRLDNSDLVVGALTNGNCHATGDGLQFEDGVLYTPPMRATGAMDMDPPFSLLDFCVTAADAGSAKPNVAVFLAAAESASRVLKGRVAERNTQVRPNELIHVGDDLYSDVAGSLAAGCRAVYLKRGEDDPDLADLPQHLERVVRRGMALDDSADSSPYVSEIFPDWEERCVQVSSLEDLCAAIRAWVPRS